MNDIIKSFIEKISKIEDKLDSETDLYQQSLFAKKWIEHSKIFKFGEVRYPANVSHILNRLQFKCFITQYENIELRKRMIELIKSFGEALSKIYRYKIDFLEDIDLEKLI